MNCPWCGGKMRPGILHFDGRGPIRWIPEDERKSASDRLWDSLGGVGSLTAQKRNGWGTGKLAAPFCPSCKKMVIDTDIEK